MDETRNDDTFGKLPTLGRPVTEKKEPQGPFLAWTDEDAERETLKRPVSPEEMTLAGRYKVLRRLGEGGMGSVWLAEDLKLDGRKVAIKMLPAVLAGKKGAYRQVKQEALMAMKLSHPNIATVRAFEEEDGNPFLVMDYIEGQGLDDILAEKGKLSEEETLRLLTPVAAALDYAHGQGVVHRDVKPGNVIVRKDGTPFVLDFGIAREIQETMTRVTGKFSSGTLLYMSPEQLRGHAPKAAQDVYSFAVVAYECLTGHPPFYRGGVEDQIKNEPPEKLPEIVGEPLRRGVMTGLAKAPEGRPGSCAGVLGGGAECIRPSPRTPRKTDGNTTRGKNRERETVDERVFLWKVRLEKTLEKSSREEMTPSELDRLAKARTLFSAGEEAMRSGQIATASALYTQTEEALNALRTAFTARRKEEIRAERARKELERCREVERKAREEEGRRREEAIRAETAKRAEEEATRTRATLRRRGWTWFFVFVAVAGASCWQIGFSRRAHPGATERQTSPSLISDKEKTAQRTGTPGLAPGTYAGQATNILLQGNKTMDKEKRLDGSARPERSELETRASEEAGEEQQPLEVKKTAQMVRTQTIRTEAPKSTNLAPNDVKGAVGLLPTLPVPWAAPGEGTRAGKTQSITLPGNATMEMVWCPAGSFMMGSPTSEAGRMNNETQHRVTLTEGFWIAKTEVTRKQWESVMGAEGIPWPEGDDLPASPVTWDECMEFCQKTGFRLPTEAEWEYACRAGSDTAYFWGNALNGEYANCNGHAPCGTRTKGPCKDRETPVGSYKPNAWGLYDMHGNVYEWCADWYTRDLGTRETTNPTGPATGTDRVLRGGAWHAAARNCRSAARIPFRPTAKNHYYGFRPVCSAGSVQ